MALCTTVKNRKQYHTQGHAVSPHRHCDDLWYSACSLVRTAAAPFLPLLSCLLMTMQIWNLGVKRTSFCPRTDVHGGREVSRAVHLLGAGVCPGLSGSASLPGTGGDPDRRERSARAVLAAKYYSSQIMS